MSIPPAVLGDGLLPANVMSWLARELGAEIIDIVPRAGGGASREGAMLKVVLPERGLTDCYLTYDLRAPEQAARLAGFEAEASAIAAMRGTPVNAPPLIAYDVSSRAMLTERVAGETRFDVLTEETARCKVAADFMRQLAALHALDINTLPLRGFAPLKPLRVAIKDRLDSLANKHAEGEEDPLMVFALRWLQDNVPDEPRRQVLVHGDAGPANFLHHEGQVTAILDWEMTHFGDPMEDLAWIAVRDLFQPFVPLPECFGVYSEASGVPVDLPRVRYHRAYALINLVIDTHADLVQKQGDFAGIYGNYLMYYTLHCKVLVESIAESLGEPLVPLNIPASTPSPRERSYTVALQELRELVIPHVDNEVAVHRLKSMARLIKYWQACDRYSAEFAKAERREIAGALNANFDSLEDARRALVVAIRNRDVSDGQIIRLLWNRVQRDNALMTPAMGALAKRHFAPLT